MPRKRGAETQENGRVVCRSGRNFFPFAVNPSLYLGVVIHTDVLDAGSIQSLSEQQPPRGPYLIGWPMNIANRSIWPPVIVNRSATRVTLPSKFSSISTASRFPSIRKGPE